MTKKHFQAIADILRDHDAKPELKSELARYFKSLNPRFNRDRFLQACEKTN